jgi:cellulose synthase/poly-beta-1,6-N-acetylglucosamine synthase-like glycosyltransferase
MYFQGLSFTVLLALSGAIPIGIIWAGVEGSSEWFFWLSLVMFSYDFGQRLFVLGLAWLSASRPGLRSQPGSPPSIAVVVPAWNEEAALPKTIATVLEQDDPPDAIIISDDGSTDGTIPMLTECYDLVFEGDIGRSRLYSNLQVLCKEHSGKGDSINQGVARSEAEVVLILDADTLLYPGSIRSLRQTFARYPQLQVVSGTLVPYCSPSLMGGILQFFQRYEYAFLHLWRLAWSYLNSTLIVSGACSAFRRQTLLEIGGFSLTSWVEDYEIMYRLQRYLRQRQKPCYVMVQPDLCARTDAPATIYSFLRQRRRWAGGFLETMLLYRQMVGDRRYGVLGWGYLVHNAFSIAHPFYSLAWLIAGAALFLHGQQTHFQLLVLLLISILLGAIVVGFSVHYYRHYFHRREVSPGGAVLELLLRPFFYLHLVVLSHIWGYISGLRRRRNW